MRLETSGYETASGNARSGDRYWGGFAAGALIGTAAAATAIMVANALTRNKDHRIMRLEDSIQVARPVDEVFRAWSEFTHLPEYIDAVRRVEVNGTHSVWTVSANGKDTRWEAETVQYIPNEAIGWKSVAGPKHTGRISFSPLSEQTIVHVTMNYASPLGRLSLLASPVSEVITSVVNEALRDFKAAMEGRGSRRSEAPAATGPADSGWREAGKDRA
ncbi:MAG TPA: SRPBCC family protein, partial [Terriglobales bacterium]|nr:SRPBCC family protein [Terriglobales bacterium]